MLLVKDDYLYFDELELYNRNYSKDELKLSEKLYQIWTPFLMDSQLANWMEEKKGNCYKKNKRKRPHSAGRKSVPEFLEKNCSLVQNILEKFRKEFSTRATTSACSGLDETMLLNAFFMSHFFKHRFIVLAKSTTPANLSDPRRLTTGNRIARNFVKMAPKYQPMRNNSQSQLKEIDIGEESASSLLNLYGQNQSPNSACETILVKNRRNQCLFANSMVFPPNSSALLGDVSNVEFLNDASRKFDFVVIDPPWPNRTVKRQKTYEMFDRSFSLAGNTFDQLIRLPIGELLSEKGILCIWLSNSESAHQSGRMLLEKWKMHKLICKYGDPICAFRSEHKLPFESFILACHDDETERRQFTNIPDDFCIISVPNACPSRKPPLSILLHQLGHIPRVQNGLELFARYMLPNFTSVGYEATKFQHQYYLQNNSVDDSQLESV